MTDDERPADGETETTPSYTDIDDMGEPLTVYLLSWSDRRGNQIVTLLAHDDGTGQPGELYEAEDES